MARKSAIPNGIIVARSLDLLRRAHLKLRAQLAGKLPDLIATGIMDNRLSVLVRSKKSIPLVPTEIIVDNQSIPVVVSRIGYRAK